MAKVCSITGKRTRVGNHVSHAHNKSKRKFYVNLQWKRFYIPSDNKWVRLQVSTAALRLINRKGIEAVWKQLQTKSNG